MKRAETYLNNLANSGESPKGCVPECTWIFSPCAATVIDVEAVIPQASPVAVSAAARAQPTPATIAVCPEMRGRKRPAPSCVPLASAGAPNTEMEQLAPSGSGVGRDETRGAPPRMTAAKSAPAAHPGDPGANNNNNNSKANHNHNR